jgi:glycosyltransferase involved in cell wall biosynthesis
MGYRLKVFDELYRRSGGRLEVWSGVDWFSVSEGVPASDFPWHRRLTNRFIFKRRILWQSGHMDAAFAANICILEFNPRILSNWIILVVRRLLGAETIIWGHLFPRAGAQAPTAVIRFAMMLLARGINLYTHSEARILEKIFPRVRTNVSPNSVMWRRECHPSALRADERTRLLFVARLVPEKKPDLLLEAFAAAIARLPAAIRLDFVGTGPCEASLRRRIEELGLSDRVHLHGAIYETDLLRPLYDEAIATFSTGYVGLSSTQSFGFGVPMLIAAEERHSVEIELCKVGFNCAFFKSDEINILSENIVRFVTRRPLWACQYESISHNVRESYTLDHMCDGFMKLFAPFLKGVEPLDGKIRVAIAWLGLPYYAARVIRTAMDRHPDWHFTIISSRDVIPYDNIESMFSSRICWLDAQKSTSWLEIGEQMPDLMIITSWPYQAYRSLAQEAKDVRGTRIIVMFDNYLRYTPKQIAGFFYYRIVLRYLFSAAWVPGESGRRFALFLGVAAGDIYTGLYAADHNTFHLPDGNVQEQRDGLTFVGQLVPRKGLSALSNAIRTLRKERILFKFELFGEGPMKANLVACGLHVSPFQNATELAKIYRKASALILPSKLDHWGVVVHEAALCGCLLLVTRQCGCARELVHHGVNGYIMEHSSEEEMVKAISWWLQLSEVDAAKGRIESIRLAEKFSPQKWADTLDDLVAKFVTPSR